MAQWFEGMHALYRAYNQKIVSSNLVGVIFIEIYNNIYCITSNIVLDQL